MSTSITSTISSTITGTSNSTSTSTSTSTGNSEAGGDLGGPRGRRALPGVKGDEQQLDEAREERRVLPDLPCLAVRVGGEAAVL